MPRTQSSLNIWGSRENPSHAAGNQGEGKEIQIRIATESVYLSRCPRDDVVKRSQLEHYRPALLCGGCRSTFCYLGWWLAAPVGSDFPTSKRLSRRRLIRRVLNHPLENKHVASDVCTPEAGKAE